MFLNICIVFKKIYNNLYSFKVKTATTINLFRPSPDIVKAAMVNPSGPSGSSPNTHNLQRIQNRQREKSRPAEPQDFDFEVKFV